MDDLQGWLVWGFVCFMLYAAVKTIQKAVKGAMQIPGAKDKAKEVGVSLLTKFLTKR